MNDEDYKIIKLISDRIDDINERIRVVNDGHTRLELEFHEQQKEFVELKTQIITVVKIIKYLVPSSLILSAVVFVVKLFELIGWV